MKWLEASVDRPLPVFLAGGLIVLLGLWCLSELAVNRTPSIEIPYAVVFALSAGAAPEDVESELTIVLEEELNMLDDLRHINSISREGVSTHVLEFKDRTDMKTALREVRDRADLAQVEFPEEADAAVVKEISFDDEPIIFFTLSGADLYRLREIAEDLEPVLESVEGVSDVDVFGGYRREVHIFADPRVLAQHGLTQADLALAVRSQSRSIPSGELRSETGQKLIRATGEFRSLEEIRSLTVAHEPAGPLALRDVARVELGHERVTSGAWRNGEPSVTLIVRRRPGVNTLETVERLHASVDALRAELPPGVRIAVSSDSSEDIATMLYQLGTSAVFGLVLVVGVLLAMFGLRQALLIASALPFSLLFTIVGLYLLGMELSNIALFALILVLGLVVDGAIIVGDAIQAEREAGLRPTAAAKAGITSVGLPVISADLTTIAAFMPMLLMVGVMGQFMSVMPKVVIFALLGSVFVDHLFLPAASARLRGRRGGSRRHLAPDGLPWFSPELPRARRFYLSCLEAALRHPGAVLGSVAAACLGAVALFTTGAIDSIFLPDTDGGRFTLDYELPLGTGIGETNRVGLLLAREVEALPEFQSHVLTTGDTGALNTRGRDGGRVGAEYGRLTVELVPRAQRVRSQHEVIVELRERVARYAGVKADLEGFGEGPPTGATLAIRIRGEQLEELASVATAVERMLGSLPGAADVRVDYDRSKPEIRVDLDRARAAAAFGIAPDALSVALRTAFYGAKVGRMWVDGERVDLRLRAPDEYAHTLNNVRELPLRTADGSIVPLGELADVRTAFAQNAIFRHDTLRTITVRADAAEGFSSVLLEEDAGGALAGLPVPAGVTIDLGGESEERDRSYASLWDALKWGALLIYVIIAIQFNSLLQPVIVLAAIPLSVVGVATGLLVTGTPFSFLVFIGIVSLTGIVVNNGIVLIDAINKRRRAGMPLGQAIRDASVQRFRAVLLTTVTTTACLLPLTLNVTEGGEFWVPLGIAIISGLLAASVLTLFVVPVLYSLLEGRPRGLSFAWLRGRQQQRARRPAPRPVPTGALPTSPHVASRAHRGVLPEACPGHSLPGRR